VDSLVISESTVSAAAVMLPASSSATGDVYDISESKKC